MGFKERLKEKRLEAGLTQAELAEKVSVTARTIQNYEMGSRKPGNMKVVGDIATVLGTTPEYLLTSADVYSVEAHQKGGAKAARPSSIARSQVMRLPERILASATITPRQRPAMMRLRAGK